MLILALMLSLSAIPVLSQSPEALAAVNISALGSSALHVGMQSEKSITDLDRYGNRPVASLDWYTESPVFNVSRTSTTEPWVSIPDYARVTPVYPPGTFLTSDIEPPIQTLVPPMYVGSDNSSAIGQKVQVGAGSSSSSAIGQPEQAGSGTNTNSTSAIGQPVKVGIASGGQPSKSVVDLSNYTLLEKV